MKKNTGELMEDLMEAGSFDLYLKQNRAQMISSSVGMQLKKLCRRRRISKALAARRSGLSEVYLHQVLAGRRSPSRNKVLCLCIGLSATMEETQDLLRQAGYAGLDPRKMRDAVILYGISRGQSLEQIKSALLERGEQAL